MARFDLKKAKQQADAEAPLATGYYRAVIVQLAEVGLQRDYDPTREPAEKFGIVFGRFSNSSAEAPNQETPATE